MDHSKPAPEDLERMDEELTAYLDGELVGETLRAIEQRLASDELFRQRLQLLDRSWSLLDKLPKQEIDQKFAATTVEMVALHAGVLEQYRRNRPGVCSRSSSWYRNLGSGVGSVL